MKKLLAIVVLGLIYNSYIHAWEKTEIKNDFDNDKQVLIFSDFVKPNRSLDFPYKDLKARIIYSCTDGRGAIRFNMDPNLTGGTFGSGLEQKYSLRAKVDDSMISLSGTQPENYQKDIMFKKKDTKKLFNAKAVMIEFKHYAGIVYYKFDISSFPGC